MCGALESRQKYKEETTRLNQALKSASMGSKANDKAADRLQKEVDKLRCVAGWQAGGRVLVGCTGTAFCMCGMWEGMLVTLLTGLPLLSISDHHLPTPSHSTQPDTLAFCTPSAASLMPPQAKGV